MSRELKELFDDIKQLEFDREELRYLLQITESSIDAYEKILGEGKYFDYDENEIKYSLDEGTTEALKEMRLMAKKINYKVSLELYPKVNNNELN